MCVDMEWDVVIVIENDQIVGTLPYSFQSGKNGIYICQPRLTQTMGPWLRDQAFDIHREKLGFQKRILSKLIDRLPEFLNFDQNFHHSITNWLPFYWKGFKQTTFYSYVLDDIGNYNNIWENFSADARRRIQKATDDHKLKIVDKMDCAAFYELNKMTFDRKQLEIPYTLELVTQIGRACEDRNSGKILIAQNEQGIIYSSVFLVWDQNSAYYLMGGTDPQFKNSGASSLLIWESIKRLSAETSRFDFEGSMVESIENFFRSFGASQIPYFHITKTSNENNLSIAMAAKKIGKFMSRILK